MGNIAYADTFLRLEVFDNMLKYDIIHIGYNVRQNKICLVFQLLLGELTESYEASRHCHLYLNLDYLVSNKTIIHNFNLKKKVKNIYLNKNRKSINKLEI